MLDMGMHMLRLLPGLHLVMQLLVPGLEERARTFPPLTSSLSTPGGVFREPALQVLCSGMLQGATCGPACAGRCGVQP